MNDFAHKPEAEDEEPEFKPLTPEQAAEWRKRSPPFSVWRVVAVQGVVGLALVLLAWAITQQKNVAVSAAWGALCVVVPSALFARGVARAGRGAGSALVGLFVWEAAKIALTVAMLWVGIRWLGSLNWLALLAGMVVTMKSYWFVLLVRSGVRKTN